MGDADAKQIKPPVVLIVEDEWFIRSNLAECFRNAGYIVVEAANAGHAMAVCHDGMQIHVLITDIHLDDNASGWDVAQRFRAIQNTLPVIYTSGNIHDRARSVPNSLFFNKPYQPEEIVRACENLLTASN
jgi:CheY-like chemotaxis protein